MSSEQVAPAEETPQAVRAQPRRRGWVTFLRDILVIVVVALLVSFLVKTFLVRSFYIPSASMNQTLIVNDRILVDEITPRFGEYSRGDVVVFRDPGGWLPPSPTPARPPFVEGAEWVLSLVGLSAPDSDEHLIKRIIGVPGDHVVCCNPLGQTTVNGQAIDETPYLNLPPGKAAPDLKEYDVVVPENSLWVMGDNRDNSQDSRYHEDEPGAGFVPLENVVGRAFLITWPFDRFGMIDFHHGVFAGVPAPEGAP
jgi:signal peptidase I